jgi:hypothetical protein
MVPALLVWLRVIRDAETGGRLSPDAATRRVFFLEARAQHLWASQLDILCNVFADYNATHRWFYNRGGAFEDEY